MKLENVDILLTRFLFRAVIAFDDHIAPVFACIHSARVKADWAVIGAMAGHSYRSRCEQLKKRRLLHAYGERMSLLALVSDRNGAIGLRISSQVDFPNLRALLTEGRRNQMDSC